VGSRWVLRNAKNPVEENVVEISGREFIAGREVNVIQWTIAPKCANEIPQTYDMGQLEDRKRKDKFLRFSLFQIKKAVLIPFPLAAFLKASSTFSNAK